MHRATLQSQRDIARTIIARRFPQHWPTHAFSRLRTPKPSGAPGVATFIDVLPHPPKPQSLPAGTIWREKPRLNIPGSVWLPDTGYGTLAAATEDYLRHGLARASGGNNAKLLVIYCQADCWMSWNAAKRALSYGYPNVAWYPEGTDGWLRANLPVAESQPEPRAGEEESSPR
jgi:PQQ-dependent catabolism-associated CXXCW motif protein